MQTSEQINDTNNDVDEPAVIEKKIVNLPVENDLFEKRRILPKKYRCRPRYRQGHN